MALPVSMRGWPSEFWLFGFLPTVYTNDWRTGPALVLFVEFAFNLFAFHGADAVDADSCSEILYMLTVNSVNVILGVLTGLAFVYATDFPNVFDVRFFYSDVQRAAQLGGHLSTSSHENRLSTDGYDGTPWRAKPYGCTFFGLVIAVPLIFASILMFSGLFTMVGPRSITQSQSTAIGVVLLVIGVVLLFTYVVAICCGVRSARIPDGHDKSDELNLKYAFFFALPLLTSAIFDFALGLSLGARWGVTVAAVFIVYLVTAFAGRYDRYFGTENAARVYLTFLLLWTIHATLYLGSVIFTTLNGIFAWLAILSLVWILVLLAAGLFRRSNSSREDNLRQQAIATQDYMTNEVTSESHGTELLLEEQSTAAVDVYDQQYENVRRRRRSNLRSGSSGLVFD